MLVNAYVKAGNVLEIMQFEYHPAEPGRSRAAKVRESDKKQIERNLRKSRRNCARLINENFAGDGMWVGLDYHDEALPADEHAAVEELQKFFRRLRRRRQKLGLPPLKYIAATETSGRLHHHIVINKIEYAELKSLWKHGRVSYSEMDSYTDYISIANYITKERRDGKFKKKWLQSKNLRQPVVTIDVAEQPGVLKIPRGYKELDRSLEAGEVGAGLYIRAIKVDRRRESGKAKGQSGRTNSNRDLQGRKTGQGD